MAKQTVGGQAVLEGVMMRAPEGCAVACRRPDGEIEVRMVDVPKHKKDWRSWPFIRGVFNMVYSLTLGMKTLNISADIAGQDEEEPSKFEKWLAEKTGRNINDVIMLVAVILAVGLAMLLFAILPAAIAMPLKPYLQGSILYNLVEGVVRILIFLGYLLLATRLNDIKRTFRYHGAEHKTVACYEADEELTPENARKHSRMHPRCGTSFIFLVMIISILVYSVMGVGSNIFTRVLTRIIMLPVVAGVSYEVLFLLAKFDNPVTRALRWPGMQLQRITALEPDDSMLEVAIAAFNAAVEGKAPEKPVTAEEQVEAEIKEEMDSIAPDLPGEGETA